MAEELLKPEHLGDGVYIHDEGYRICLAVNHHENKVIYMEENEIKNLIRYAKRAKIIKLLILFLAFSFNVQAQLKHERVPTFFVSGAVDMKMVIEGPHGEGGVFNPEFIFGVTIPNLDVNIWAGYEYLKEIEYQKYTYLGIDYKPNIINHLFETSIGIELSVINRVDSRPYSRDNSYFGPETNLSIGTNLTFGYHLNSYATLIANTNVFTAEKFDNFGNEMKALRWDVRVGVRIYLFKIP